LKILFFIGFEFKIKRALKHGGDISYTKYDDLETAFANKEIHPVDLKQAVIASVNTLLDPIRKKFEDPKLVELTLKAYPGSPFPLPATTNSSSKNTTTNQNPSSKPTHKQVDTSEHREQSDLSRLDIRVGEIKKASKHPDADSLYVEEIDVGDAAGATRTVISGLAKYIPLEELVGKKVLVLCNLKPVAMRGIKSFGMVLAASNEDHSAVELVLPPCDAIVGESVKFGEEHEGAPDEVLNPKKKVWEKVQVDLKIDSNKIAVFKDKPLRTSKGTCSVKSLSGASIS